MGVHAEILPGRPVPAGLPHPVAPAARARRQWSGRRNHLSGDAAEGQVAAHYRRAGAGILERRLRTPEGEVDLIAERDGILIFVEVKRTRRVAGFESPVSDRQWRRLENAALHYMMGRQVETGVQPFCRFDVALVGPDGSLQIIENARSFDA